MNKKIMRIFLLLTLALTSTCAFIAAICYIDKVRIESAPYYIAHPDYLEKLFPQTCSQIIAQEKLICDEIDLCLKDILANPTGFENSLKPFDHIIGKANNKLSVLAVLQYLSPNSELRNQAQISSLSITNYLNEKILLNQALYLKIKDYLVATAQEDARQPDQYLSDAQYLFAKSLLLDFKLSGLELPNEKLKQIRLLKAQINDLEQAFMQNLGQDQTTITLKASELEGLDQNFIARLPQNDAGDLSILCNDHNYLQIMSNCKISKTRERLYRVFTQKCYPQNKLILDQLIAKRDELAQTLEFDSYASLALSDQMIKTTLNAYNFLNELLPAAKTKAKKEIALICQDLPASVLLEQAKIQPWDLLFIKNSYKQKYLNLDEELVRQYFPQTSTIDKLLNIYENFLNLRFEKIETPPLWCDQQAIITLAVYEKKHARLVGYLLLDLFARPNKLPHSGAQISLMPALINGKQDEPAVAVVFTNFEPASHDRPALLTYQQVKTFFHEFGHAMHTLLGRTLLTSQSGTRVKTDFVEMPSQMMEYWMLEPAVLKEISSHYQTKLALPDDLIKTIVTAQTFDTGEQLSRQISLSLLALQIYGPGASKDIKQLRSQLAQEIYDYVVFDPNNQAMYTSLHLASSDYGPRYYGYLWSRIFASDLFAKIKGQGLNNHKVGQNYVAKVLSKGGSREPQDLLQDFLGRAPNQEAFRKELGLID